MTKKQRADRVRVRVKYDIDPELKRVIEVEARRQGTSASQLAAFLLAFSVTEARKGNAEIRQALAEGRSPSNNMRFDWNLDAPEAWKIDAAQCDGDN